MAITDHPPAPIRPARRIEPARHDPVPEPAPEAVPTPRDWRDTLAEFEPPAGPDGCWGSPVP